MSDEEIDLDQSVSDVKQAIRQSDNSDYSEIVKKEKGGEARKTLIQFLEKKIRNKQNSIWIDCPKCGDYKIKRYKKKCGSCNPKLDTAPINRGGN